MTEAHTENGWWKLHLKNAKGESLTKSEQKVYDEAIASLEATDPLQVDVEKIKRLRAEIAANAKLTDELRRQAAELQEQIQRIEQSMSKRSRDLLVLRHWCFDGFTEPRTK